jgi:hypothetical protein
MLLFPETAVKFEKRRLVEMDRCYAVAAINTRGEDKILFATEGEGPCVAFSGPDFSRRETVYEGPGGCMGMVPVPGCRGDFLAVQKFFRMYRWEEALLVWMEALEQGGWRMHELLALPYLHRFDILTAPDGRSHLVVCTLAASKDSRDDWSTPGCVYVAPMPRDWTQETRLRPLRADLFQNHGYCRAALNGRTCGLVGARQGVFAVFPPRDEGEDWSVEQLLDTPAGDVAVTDIDGDGKPEMAVIEGFHGRGFSVYRENRGVWTEMYRDADDSDFHHVAWGGMLGSLPVFLGGCRRGSRELFLLTCENGRMVRRVVDAGAGPSNAAVAVVNGAPYIVSANREIGEGAIYRAKHWPPEA